MLFSPAVACRLVDAGVDREVRGWEILVLSRFRARPRRDAPLRSGR